jgi:hypothetical protein
MKRTLQIGTILGAMLLLVACHEEIPERDSWVPALEQTGFEYLSDAGARIQKALQTARGKMASGNPAAALSSIAEAENAVQVLRYYDIPITEVRQLIYDAGRLHALNRQQDALNYLDKSTELLLKMEQHGDQPLRQALQEIRDMTADLRLRLADEQSAATLHAQAELSGRVAAKFHELGHKINLLALKSAMLLAGSEFTPSGPPE